MATEQLPSDLYLIGGQATLSGYEIISSGYGFEEQTEDKFDAAGAWKAKITFSRRQTCSIEAEALAAGTPGAEYIVGGGIASGSITLADGSTPSAWIIRSASMSETKSVTTLSLDLIEQGDATD